MTLDVLGRLLARRTLVAAGGVVVGRTQPAFTAPHMHKARRGWNHTHANALRRNCQVGRRHNSAVRAAHVDGGGLAVDVVACVSSVLHSRLNATAYLGASMAR